MAGICCIGFRHEKLLEEQLALRNSMHRSSSGTVHVSRTTRNNKSLDLNSTLTSLMTMDLTSASPQSGMAQKKLERVMEDVAEEIKMNEEHEEKYKGREVLFGDVIQLRHIQTGMLLMNGHRVFLSSNANSQAFFAVKSCSHVRKEGDNVHASDLIHLCPVEQEDATVFSVYLSMHMPSTYSLKREAAKALGQKPGNKGADLLPPQLSVVCTAQAVRWKVMLYQSYSPEADASTRGLTAGDIVWIAAPSLGLFLQTALCDENVQSSDMGIHHVKSEIIEAVPGDGSGRTGALDGMFEIEFAKPTGGGPIRCPKAQSGAIRARPNQVPLGLGPNQVPLGLGLGTNHVP